MPDNKKAVSTDNLQALRQACDLLYVHSDDQNVASKTYVDDAINTAIIGALNGEY